MCGIYGFIGKTDNSAKALKLFTKLGINSESRGTHATGYYALNGDIHFDKAPIKASEFYTQAFTEKFVNDLPTVMIGHNRYATHGDPANNENNHPFVSKRFGFIHNGVVGYTTTATELGVKIHSECDSELIFRYFLKKFWESEKAFSSISDTLKKFDNGGVACAMVDSKKRRLWLFRNVDRGIAYTYINDNKMLVFASTEYILKTSLKECKIKHSEIESVKSGEIMRIDEELNIYTMDVKLREPLPEIDFEFPKTKIKVSRSLTNYQLSLFNKLGIQTAKPSKDIITTPWFPLPPKKTSSTTTIGSAYHKCKKCKRQFISPEHLGRHFEKEHQFIFPEDKNKWIDQDSSYSKLTFTETGYKFVI